jgi:hypothetical protein
MPVSEAFRAAVQAWQKVLQIALDYKQIHFQADADEAMRFYARSNYEFLYTLDTDDLASQYNMPAVGEPRHKMAANLVSNMVQVLLPVLYHRNPTRLVTARLPDVDVQLMAQHAATMHAALDPATGQPAPIPMPGMMDQHWKVKAQLMTAFLNATPGELNLRRECRRAITDALISGMGIVWCELVETASGMLPGSFYVCSRDVLFDSDETELRDCRWVARRKRVPVWQAETMFGWPRGDLKGNAEGRTNQGWIDGGGRGQETRLTDEQTTNDQIEYWEIYSRMGLGGRLRGLNEEAQAILDQLGQYVYLVVAKGVDYPLNVPPHLFEWPPDQLLAELQARLAWPIPTYKRARNPWPFAALWFHERTDCVYPQSHVMPAMSYQKAINWIYTYLLGRLRVASRTLMACPQGLDERVKEQILYGGDLELIELKTHDIEKFGDILRYIQVPEVTAELWKVLSAVKHEFELATGVTELLQTGMTSQAMRSATEAQVKQGLAQLRPDDMATMTEEWMGEMAANEAFAAELFLGPEDVAPIFGEPYNPGDPAAGIPEQMGPLTRLWMEVAHSPDLSSASSTLEYRVESGSARKPNKEWQQSQAMQAMQTFMPLLMPHYQQTGDPTQINRLLTYWARAQDIEDYESLLLPDRRAEMAAMQQAMQQAPSGNRRPPPSEAATQPLPEEAARILASLQ